MFRLSVIAANESLRQTLASRLRGMTIEPDASPACDAIACLGPPTAAIEPFLQFGKPVLVAPEGPLTKEMLQALSVASRSSGAAIEVVNPDRYLPSRQLIRQQLDAGKLGAPGLVRIHRWEPPGQSGSLLRDLDLALWYHLGRETIVIYAVAHARGTQVHLGFATGGMALIEHAQVPANEAYQSLTVIGSSGAAYADDHQNMQLAYRGGSPVAVRAAEVMQWPALVQDFVERVKAGKVGAFDGPQWSDVTGVADALEQSLKSKQAVVPEGVK